MKWNLLLLLVLLILTGCAGALYPLEVYLRDRFLVRIAGSCRTTPASAVAHAK